MRKIFLLIGMLLAFSVTAQTPPPLYDAEGEALPPDLAIEKERPKVRPAAPSSATPSPSTPSVESATPLIKPEAQTPSETEPSAITPPPANVPTLQAVPKAIEPTLPEQTLPEEITVVPVTTQPQKLDDGGPWRDAGSDLNSALPITFGRYGENYLSTKDNVDIFKFYARAGEGVALILTPLDGTSQMSVDLMGKNGERLSQSAAKTPGESISFQTSPLRENDIIYIQIKDLSLTAAVPNPNAEESAKRYSLELRPMATVAALPPPPPPPPPAVAPAPPLTAAPVIEPKAEATTPVGATTPTDAGIPPAPESTATGEATATPPVEPITPPTEPVTEPAPPVKKKKRKPVNLEEELLDEEFPDEGVSMLEDPLILGTGGAIILLLLFLWFRKRRKKTVVATAENRGEELAEDEEWEEVEIEIDEGEEKGK